MFDLSRRSPVARARKLGVETLETRDVPSTLLVDDDRRQFRNAPYTTISAAVAAANPGDRILVARGTYTEQVVIPADLDGLRLESDRPRQAVVVAPAAATTGAVIEVDGAEDVRITGFTITGPGTVAAGIIVDNGGSATISRNDILDIRRDPIDGVQLGIGVLVGGVSSAGSSGPGEAVISDNTITGYQKGGIAALGDGTSVVVTDNRITGIGRTGVIAQNGIQVSDGADGRVVGNTVTRNNYTGEETFASGIIVQEAGDVIVADNRLTSNDVGLFVSTTDGVRLIGNDVRNSLSTGVFLFELSDATVVGNEVINSARAGIFIQGVTDSVFALNTSRNNDGYGIGVTASDAQASSGNTFILNTARGNGAEDAFDDSTGSGTAGTANTWLLNRFGTTSPRGLR